MLQNYNLLFGFMESLGKKWVVPLLILLLFYERATFTKIKKHLGVTSRALSKKLKLLEALGLVEKIVVVSPRNAGYSLSEEGIKISNMLLKFSANFVR